MTRVKKDIEKKSNEKKKNKKSKHIMGIKEFLFNFFSLIFMLGVGVYFGYRSLYYYSKQNQKIQDEAQTLNGTILQSTYTVSAEDAGLHHDSMGYYYKGNVDNNYVSFQNRLFRIVRIHDDNTVRLITDDYVAVFPWGNQPDYLSSNVHHWLDKTEGLLSGVYYKTIPNIEKYLVKMKYKIDQMTGETISSLEEEQQGMISLLSATDYILAGGKNSYLNNGKMFFLLGITDQEDNIYVDIDGSIQHCTSSEGFGIRPVITLKANTIITGGVGTIDNPYVIYQDKEDMNYLYSYVKIGEDIWRVFQQDNTVVRLSYNGYAMINGVECAEPYSKKISYYDMTNSIFDTTSYGGIGYYLNHTYLASLPYQDLLLEFPAYTGEVSDDKGYQFGNIYHESVMTKVGLLNVFDILANTSLEDFFRGNTTSEMGNLEYNSTADGRLLESDVTEVKHIVPVISIDISHIKGGTGSSVDPYIVG